MSKKDNDINELDEIEHRRRVRAMLSGGYRAPAAVADERPIVSETPIEADEDDEIVGGDEALDVDETSAAIAAWVALTPIVVGAPSVLQKRAEPRDLLRLYLLACVAPKTRETRWQGLQRCAAAIGADAATLPWHELRLEHTTAIRAALADPTRGYRKATIESSLWALRGILRYAERLGFLTFDDLRRATTLDPIVGDELPAGRALEPEEIAKLRAYCESEGGLYGRFLDATFALLLGVGLRASEACRMPIGGYDAAAEVVRVRRKGGKEAELPVDGRACECLDAWARERQQWKARLRSPAFLLRVQKNDWINEKVPELNVRTLEYILKCVAETAGVASFTPHDLRRTFCTRLLDAGVDLAMAQRLMSHSDPKTTEKYDRRGAQKMARVRKGVEIW